VNSRAERSRDEAEALATELRDRALAGDDLETLAKEHSDGSSAPRGGRLGVYATDTMVPDFERAVASVEPGAIGPLVSTPFGFHVVRRDAVVEAKAAHVLVAHADAWRAKTDRSRSEARARAQQALAKLQAGASFAEVAAEFSDDSTAETGGDLGRIAPGQMIPAFEDALFALEPGALSGVVETPYGFHVIRRIE
jgi:peptidyl-prolyl cis-trans isomerase SurA